MEKFTWKFEKAKFFKNFYLRAFRYLYNFLRKRRIFLLFVWKQQWLVIKSLLVNQLIPSHIIFFKLVFSSFRYRYHLLCFAHFQELIYLLMDPLIKSVRLFAIPVSCSSVIFLWVSTGAAVCLQLLEKTQDQPEACPNCPPGEDSCPNCPPGKAQRDSCPNCPHLPPFQSEEELQAHVRRCRVAVTCEICGQVRETEGPAAHS